MAAMAAMAADDDDDDDDDDDGGGAAAAAAGDGGGDPPYLVRFQRRSSLPGACSCGSTCRKRSSRYHGRFDLQRWIKSWTGSDKRT